MATSHDPVRANGAEPQRTPRCVACHVQAAPCPVSPPGTGAPFRPVLGHRPQDSKGPRPVTPDAIAAGVFMTDRLYHGPITTAFDRRILQSPRIPYFCAKCAGIIEVPTGGDLCEVCPRDQS